MPEVPILPFPIATDFNSLGSAENILNAADCVPLLDGDALGMDEASKAPANHYFTHIVLNDLHKQLDWSGVVIFGSTKTITSDFIRNVSFDLKNC